MKNRECFIMTDSKGRPEGTVYLNEDSAREYKMDTNNKASDMDDQISYVSGEIGEYTSEEADKNPLNCKYKYNLKIFYPSSNNNKPTRYMEKTVYADDIYTDNAGCYKFTQGNKTVLYLPINLTIIERDVDYVPANN